MATRASASGGKRISQNEFTEKAWQSIIAAPDIAQNASQQIVDTEHLFKALLEQPNGLARRILAKAGSNPTQLLEKTDQYIRQQPRVTGDSSQVCCPCVFKRCSTLQHMPEAVSDACVYKEHSHQSSSDSIYCRPHWTCTQASGAHTYFIKEGVLFMFSTCCRMLLAIAALHCARIS